MIYNHTITDDQGQKWSIDGYGTAYGEYNLKEIRVHSKSKNNKNLIIDAYRNLIK